MESSNVTELVSTQCIEIGENDSLNPQHIQNLLNKISHYITCQGIKGYEQITSLKTGIKSNGVWHSIHCKKVGDQKCCVPCKLLHLSLCRKSISQRKISSKGEKLKTIKLRSLRKKLKNTTFANTKLKMKVKRMEINLKHAHLETVEKYLKNDNISRPFASAILHALKMSKLKCKKGMR